MALSGGPSLIFASSPTSWQGEHNRLNTCSPAAASCARLVPVEAVRAMTAITHILIIFSSPFVYIATSLHSDDVAPGKALFARRHAVRMALSACSVNGRSGQIVSLPRRARLFL